MEFMTISADSQAEFDEKVRAAIAEGWRPQGGVALGYAIEHEQVVSANRTEWKTFFHEKWAIALVRNTLSKGPL